MHYNTLMNIDLDRSLGDTWGGLQSLAPYLADAAAKSVVIGGVAVVAVALLRRRSAAARHLVLALAMVGLLLVPLLSALLPGWYVLPSFAVTQAGPADVPNTATDATVDGIAPKSVPAIDRTHAPAALPQVPRTRIRDAAFADQASEAVDPTQRHMDDADSDASLTVASEPTAVEAPAAEVGWIAGVGVAASLHTVTAWVGFAWLAGAAVLLASVALSWLALRRIERRAELVDDRSLLSLLDESRDRVGVRRRVTLLAESRHAMPLTWGTLRPRLLVPAAAADWPTERQQVVLLHELAHIKRCDYAAQLIAQVATALYWFNPLVWWATRRMTVEREVACDDVVLAAGERPSSYAEHLLSIAKFAGDGRNSIAAAAVAMVRSAQISGRIRAILDQHRSHAVLARRLVIAAVLAVSAIAVPLAMLRGADDQTGPAEQEPQKETVLERARQASLAIASLKSAVGTGTIRQFVWTPGVDDPDLRMEARLNIFYDRGKYHIRADYAKKLEMTSTTLQDGRTAQPRLVDWKPDDFFLLFDGQEATTVEFSKRINPSGYRHMRHPDLASAASNAGFAWGDFLRLGHQLAQLDRLVGAIGADRITVIPLPDAGFQLHYIVQNSPHLRVELDVRPELGFNVRSTRVFGADQEPQVEAVADWKESNGVWYVTELWQEQYMLGQRVRTTFKLDELQINPTVDPWLFTLDSVQMPTRREEVYAKYETKGNDHDQEPSRATDVMLLAEAADSRQRNRSIDARQRFIVHGLITDQANQPLQGVEVIAHSGMGTLRQTGKAMTDANGRYALRFGPGMLIQTGEEESLGVGIQAATISPRLDGWYEVNLHRQGNLAMADKPLDEVEKATWGGYGGVVLPRKPYRLDFVMAQGATIEGQLVNDFGRPIAGEQVSLDGDELPPSSSVLAQVETDDDGRFRFERVPLYRQWHFSLRVHGTRHELTTEPIEFDQPKRYAYELVLKSSGNRGGAAELELSAEEVAEE